MCVAWSHGAGGGGDKAAPSYIQSLSKAKKRVSLVPVSVSVSQGTKEGSHRPQGYEASPGDA